MVDVSQWRWEQASGCSDALCYYSDADGQRRGVVFRDEEDKDIRAKVFMGTDELEIFAVYHSAEQAQRIIETWWAVIGE